MMASVGIPSLHDTHPYRLCTPADPQASLWSDPLTLLCMAVGESTSLWTAGIAHPMLETLIEDLVYCWELSSLEALFSEEVWGGASLSITVEFKASRINYPGPSPGRTRQHFGSRL